MTTAAEDHVLDDCKENEQTANEPAKGRGRRKAATATNKKETTKSTSRRGKAKKEEVHEPAPEPVKKQEDEPK